MEYIHWEKRYHILFSSRQPFIYLDKNIQCKQRTTTDRRSGLQTNPVNFKVGLNPFFITLGSVVMITSPLRNSQFIKHKKTRTRKLRNPGVTEKAGKYMYTSTNVYSPRTSEATLNRSKVFWSSYILRWLNSPVSPKSRFAFFLRGKDQGTHNQSWGKNSWHVDINTFRLANVASLDRFEPMADYFKCWSVNIRTISVPMFRSCSLVSQTPVKLDSQSRTWSQQWADRQMPIKSWFSANATRR